MKTLKAIHQIRGVQVTKRAKGTPATTEYSIAFSGDTFTCDADTARSLVESGSAVEPGENPNVVDGNSRLQSIYATLGNPDIADDEDEDNQQAETFEQIAGRPPEETLTIRQDHPDHTEAKNAAVSATGKPLNEDVKDSANENVQQKAETKVAQKAQAVSAKQKAAAAKAAAGSAADKKAAVQKTTGNADSTDDLSDLGLGDDDGEEETIK